MRMHLKNNSININENNKRKKLILKRKNIKKEALKKATSKNLFIFLISFTIVSLIIGIVIYFFIKPEDKEIVNNAVTNYFTIKNNYDYLNSLKESIFKNTYNIFIIWILGLSVIGILANIFLYFCEMFSVGFTISSIISTYKTKGIVGSLIYLIPSKICYILILFILTFSSVKISYKITRLFFTKKEINIKKEIVKYIKILIFSWVSIIVVSLLSVFIDPFFIKLFTKI